MFNRATAFEQPTAHHHRAICSTARSRSISPLPTHRRYTATRYTVARALQHGRLPAEKAAVMRVFLGRFAQWQRAAQQGGLSRVSRLVAA